MEHVKVVVQRDPMEHIANIVPAHEVAILQAIHGEEFVREVPMTKREKLHLEKQLKATEAELQKLRDAAEESGDDEDIVELDAKSQVRAEHERLGTKYGMHPDVKVSFVEYVYGKPTTRALMTAMGLKADSKKLARVAKPAE